VKRCASILLAALVVVGCGESEPVGPSFAVSFDPTMPESTRDGAVRVEVYFVDSCGEVPVGTRPVPAITSTFVLRDAGAGALEDVVAAGDYGLYGVAQDADCAVVAAGCAPVTIVDAGDTHELTLSALQSAGCSTDQACSVQTGNCVEGSGGTGGTPDMRVEDGLILLYAFDEGAGATVSDQSGTPPVHDLTIADPDNVTWSTDHLTIHTGTLLSTAGAATKIVTRAQVSGALTVEAWVRPANATQTGPARLITMSENTTLRNFLLGQNADTYAARFRADGETDANNGNPTIFTTAGTGTNALTHVVFTHRSDGTEVLYVDGGVNQSFTRMGSLATWDANYAIHVANEATLNRAWLGELHLIAVYDRALGSSEVTQNFEAGP